MAVVHEEEIHEPLGRVVALFEKGRIDPLHLYWRRREYRVQRVNARWVDRQIRPCVHGFTVTVDSGDIFELAYQEGDSIWRLERIFLQ